MRTIKFRGLRIDNNEWIYGCLVESFVYTVNHSTKDGKRVHTVEKDGEHIIVTEEFLDWETLQNTVNFPVRSKSVGQYTGLKDKNEKEIYEGDVVNGTDMQSYGDVDFKNGIVEYSLDGFIIAVNEDIKVSLSNVVLNKVIEVIGNIHEKRSKQ